MRNSIKYKILVFIGIISLSCASFAQSGNRQYVDLTGAAEQSVHAVVHIKTQFLYQTSVWEDFFGDSFWSDFFGNSFPGTTQHEVLGAGSGVIISPDGYIVTNNHVVEDAKEVTVTLNDRREFKATVVGTDPQTDLALIKIETDNLPVLEFGNSDDVRIGEWVLAVGNPFNLTSTVTAGIVSAKARNLDILGKNTAIESFIQTDAAVNQGNSGGALVNVNGKLIGINSAIASGNGYFTGYSFAIPSNIARKVVADLKQYGSVQRAYIGVAVVEIDNNLAGELNLSEVKGLLVRQVTADGAAERAGLRVDDIILALDGREVNSASELKEIVAQHSPGDSMTVSFLRNGQRQKITLTLLNNVGNTNVLYGND
ncbi:MAG: trypsin-like peptidase domain-containing protein [Bacteroidales bacterium]|nr:trypsin-like peptidase domain-containing protein [Bacteroidales bacterium]